MESAVNLPIYSLLNCFITRKPSRCDLKRIRYARVYRINAQQRETGEAPLSVRLTAWLDKDFGPGLICASQLLLIKANGLTPSMRITLDEKSTENAVCW
jgi:hypothetical protein